MVAARITQPGPVGALGQGREALDERLGGLRRFAGHAGQAEVVDAEVDQDVGPAGHREQVAVEARQRVLTDLLEHQVERHLRTEGGLSYVQFQLLARLASAQGQLTMTQLADGVVYSRSGLTYQAGLLERAGLITRRPSPVDERAVLVSITDEGRALFDRVLPGHIQVVRGLLFDPLSG